MKMNKKRGGLLALLFAAAAAAIVWRFLQGYVTRPVADIFAWGKK